VKNNLCNAVPLSPAQLLNAINTLAQMVVDTQLENGFYE
jgi:hypothetical protein